MILEIFENNYLYVPTKGSFAAERIDTPLIKSSLRLYEKGLKINSEKLGYTVILFKEIQSAVSLIKVKLFSSLQF